MMPTRLAFAASLVLLSLAPRAQALDTEAAGRPWYLVSEGNLSMEVVARDAQTAGSKFPFLIVGTHFPATFSFGAPAIPGTQVRDRQVRVDYATRVVQFDCATPGRHRTFARYSYRLDTGPAVDMDTRTTPWESAAPIAQEGARQLWRIACGEEAPGKVMPSVKQHDAFTLAYRQRIATAKRQADADKQAQANRERQRERTHAATQVVPETSLDAATRSSHWHSAQATMYALAAVDVHGAVDGATANTRRMSTALLWPEGHLSADNEQEDFTVTLEEFDCTQPGRLRMTAMASYAVVGDAPTLVNAAKLSDGSWNTAREGQYTYDAWTWACRGDQKKDALPARQSFVQLLDWYRQQIAAAKAR
jgi:hypothetical protein